MKMTDEQYLLYSRNPLAMDPEVRAWFKLPVNRYYTVSVWPVPGEVRVTPGLTRELRAHKVSKSDQQNDS